jgi:hypothetical protein
MVNATPPMPTPHPKRPIVKRPIVKLLGLLGLGILGLVVWVYLDNGSSIKTRISKGDRLLIPSDPNHPATAQRKLGIDAMVMMRPRRSSPPSG